MQEPNQRLTKIYYLVSSRNLLNIRYVGKTVMSLNNRLSSHKSGKCGQYLKNWLRKELSEGFEIIINLIEEVEESRWVEREKFYIAFYKSLGFKLCNLTDGGEGMCGYKTPNHVKLKTSIRMKGNSYAKPGTPIIMIDKNKNILATFKNIKDATNITGHSFSTITNSIINNKLVYRRFYKFEIWNKTKFSEHVHYTFNESLILKQKQYIKKPEGCAKGMTGKKHSESTKQKIREATLNQFLTKGYPNSGKTQTEETRMKIRNALLNKAKNSI